MNPVVSIIIPIYKTGKFVVEALKSIASQTYPIDLIEIIIINDCSPDDSFEIVKTYLKTSALKVRVEENIENIGLVRTLNRGLREFCTGKYLTMIGDDLMLPERIKKQVQLLEQEDEYVACFSDMNVIDEKGNLLYESYLNEMYKLQLKDVPSGFIYPAIIKHNFIPAATVLYRLEALKSVNYYDEYLAFEDLDMNLKLAKNSKFLFLPECLIQYRLRKGSLSDKILDDANSVKSYFLIYQKHLGEGHDKLLTRRLNWYLERLYVLKQPQLKSIANDYMDNWCENKPLVRSIKLGLPYDIYRVIRKLTFKDKKN